MKLVMYVFLDGMFLLLETRSRWLKLIVRMQLINLVAVYHCLGDGYILAIGAHLNDGIDGTIVVMHMSIDEMMKIGLC